MDYFFSPDPDGNCCEDCVRVSPCDYCEFPPATCSITTVSRTGDSETSYFLRGWTKYRDVDRGDWNGFKWAKLTYVQAPNAWSYRQRFTDSGCTSADGFSAELALIDDEATWNVATNAQASSASARNLFCNGASDSNAAITYPYGYLPSNAGGDLSVVDSILSDVSWRRSFHNFLATCISDGICGDYSKQLDTTATITTLLEDADTVMAALERGGVTEGVLDETVAGVLDTTTAGSSAQLEFNGATAVYTYFNLSDLVVGLTYNLTYQIQRYRELTEEIVIIAGSQTFVAEDTEAVILYVNPIESGYRYKVVSCSAAPYVNCPLYADQTIKVEIERHDFPHSIYRIGEWGDYWTAEFTGLTAEEIYQIVVTYDDASVENLAFVATDTSYLFTHDFPVGTTRLASVAFEQFSLQTDVTYEAYTGFGGRTDATEFYDVLESLVP